MRPPKALFFASLISAILLLACAPKQAPSRDATMPPSLSEEQFLTSDGVALPVKIWPAEKPKAILLALHGMNDYANFFAMPGPAFAARGITTYAYDQRGFGGGPHIGVWGGAESMRRDMREMVALLRARHPALPIYALGESMGGAVLLTSLRDPQTRPAIDGAILSAPAVWSRADMPLHYRIALWTAAHIAPGMVLSGKGLQIWPSDNVEMLIANGRDPLFLKSNRVDMIWGVSNLMDEARSAPASLPADTVPLLILRGEKDQVIPAAPSKAVITELGARAEAKTYEHGYHMLMRDLSRQVVWDDVIHWITAKH